MFAPPPIWKGRVLAGGGDGRIYCLDATTGKCLWQLLAGPADRRVMWYGHLVSTWPVTGGVVVQDDVAYAVAGYFKENGLHAYAIDPASGTVKWETDNAGAGAAGNASAGLGSLGSVAAAGGKLWLASGPAGFFDLKSGEWKSAGNGSFGGEVGTLGNWVIQGGRRISETQDTVNAPLGGTGLSAARADLAPGGVPLTGAGTSLPAWDAELVVMPPGNVGGVLTAVPSAKMTAWMTGRTAPPVKAQPAAPGAPKVKPVEWADLKSWATEPLAPPVAFALAKDQLVVACTDGNKVNKVVGFRRADGAKAWTVDLPEQPAMNRLAIDRDGRVIVSLCDGSVICVGR
jgi:outer membrane protein assembly factor BamB